MVFACSRASQVAQVVKSLPANAGGIRDRCNPWVGKISCRRKWKPTPVFLLGESHRQRNLAGCSPWSCKEPESPCSWNFPENNPGLRLSTHRSISSASSSSSSTAGLSETNLYLGYLFSFGCYGEGMPHCRRQTRQDLSQWSHHHLELCPATFWNQKQCIVDTFSD